MGKCQKIKKLKSGVPQGTVIAAILFIIMINDINDIIKRCIMRCFADDTRFDMKVTTEEDKKQYKKIWTIYTNGQNRILWYLIKVNLNKCCMEK